MNESARPESLDSAAEHFISLLSESERTVLASVTLFNPLLQGGAEFIGRAMRELDLHGSMALPLLSSIHTSCPGETTNMDFMATSAEPLQAARLIVERAQMKLRGSAP